MYARELTGPGSHRKIPVYNFLVAFLLSTVLGLFLTACGGSSSPENNQTAGITTPADFEPGLAARPVNTDCLASEFLSTGAAIRLEPAFDSISFNSLVAMRPVPGTPDRWIAAQQDGQIFTFTDAANVEPVADLRSIILSGGERGFLGMAFHPDYPQVPRLFVSYTEISGGDSVNSSFVVDPATLTLDPDTEQIVLLQAQPFSNHNGGNIDFGSDGMLYIGFGDGGSGGDPQNNAQNTGNRLGALLRVDVGDASVPGYTVPADNPFAGLSCDQDAACPEIWAWGLRNPWRWSFDRVSGDLWLGDVGQNSWEEVGIVEKGKNYGWRCYEGNEVYNSNGCGDISEYQFPLSVYPRNEGRSVTGGYVYRGTEIPSLSGTYLYADFATGHIWGLSLSQPAAEAEKLIPATGLNISSFAESESGELYVLDHNGGIYQIVANPAGPAVSGPPAKLSESNCFDVTTADVPSASLIPYTVNAPFWSDGAVKQRWFALPDNTQVSVQTDGDWQFPPGSVLVKNFSLGNQLLETRFLVRHDSGDWQGYTYAWNPSATDADLITSPEVRTFSGQDWYYPAGQCLQCHTQAAGVALGLENAQLNGEFRYPSSGITANQLGTLYEIDVLSTDAVINLDDVDQLATPADSSQSLEVRARAYLHTNCSGCHRPQSTGRSNMDLRYLTELVDTGLCSEPAQFGAAGSTDGLLLEPGDAADSVLIRRMSSADPQLRMPPVGSVVVDSEAVVLISAWIDSLSQCGQ